MKKLLIVLLALSLSAVAAPCPVSIVTMNQHARSKTYRHIYVPALNVQWKNQSEKTIVGVKFQIRYFDSTGDPHEHYGTLSSDHKAKPNDTKRSQWDLEDAEDYIHHRLEIWIVKVLYDDGSSWVSADESCKFDTDHDKGSWWKR
jgi:hypothetical protein